jgi:branched-chain amino acid transport system ATP-binding protein
MSTPVLQLDGFSVAYRTVEAVHSVQLHVNEGEIVTVIGPNGAGKTTLLCAAMGLLPSTGSLALHGERVARPGVETMVARGVALVPERRELFGEM